tara:strand:- start:385 stop:642 length:258 start_codon:yes stop_codon:yes gene_type:complete
MKFGKIAACIAATSMIAAPALAQSQQSVAKPVAAKVERVSAKTENASNLEGSGTLLGILASVAVIGGFLLIAEVSESDSDTPTSP